MKFFYYLVEEIYFLTISHSRTIPNSLRVPIHILKFKYLQKRQMSIEESCHNENNYGFNYMSYASLILGGS